MNKYFSKPDEETPVLKELRDSHNYQWKTH